MVRYSHLVLQLRFTLFLPSPHGLKASLQLVRLLSHWGGRAPAAKLYRHFSGAIWPLAGAVLTPPPLAGEKGLKPPAALCRRFIGAAPYTEYTATPNTPLLQRCKDVACRTFLTILQVHRSSVKARDTGEALYRRYF